MSSTLLATESKNGQSFAIAAEQQPESPTTVYFMFQASFERLREVLRYLDELKAAQLYAPFHGNVTVEKVVPVVSGRCSCVVEVSAVARGDYLLFAHEVSARIGGMADVEIFPTDAGLERRYLAGAEAEIPQEEKLREEIKEVSEPAPTPEAEPIAAPPGVAEPAQVPDENAKPEHDEDAERHEEEKLEEPGPVHALVVQAPSRTLVALQVEKEAPSPLTSLEPSRELVAVPEQREEVASYESTSQTQSTGGQVEQAPAHAAEQAVKSEVITKYPCAQFRRCVLLGKINSLEVIIRPGRSIPQGAPQNTNNGEEGNWDTVPIEASADGKFPIVATVRSSAFDVVGPDSRVLEVPVEPHVSRAVRFELEAKNEGRQALRVLFSHGGKPLGELELATEVVAPGSKSRKELRHPSSKKGKRMAFRVSRS